MKDKFSTEIDAGEIRPPALLTVGEGFINPLGFHDATPVFSWKLPVGIKRQTAYRIEVSGDKVWDSGWVESDQSVFVPYGCEPLASRQRIQWVVRIRDESGRVSLRSQPATVELGLLSADDWSAQWIRPNTESDKKGPTSAIGEPMAEKVASMRRQFNLSGNISKARLYVTARGVFTLYLNGEKVGRDHFANGWTDYRHRVDTLTYDITTALQEGRNTLFALLGSGWYAGRLGWENKRKVYGEEPELLLQLEVTYEDHSTEIIVTDDGWEATFEGPILSSSLYDGECFDARRKTTVWSPVVVATDLGTARLAPKPMVPVRETNRLPVQAVSEPEPRRFVFDLGQNIVGWARISIPMEKDRTVTLRFAEMLNRDGSLYTENYRSARSTDYYTASETGLVEWEPTFTFHGFRYVELSGLSEDATPEKNWVTGVVLHSDLPKSGMFESSHEKLNQLQRNITWGQRGNFLDIPTDCPQRDERMGWTGDAQVFCRTAQMNYDCHAFFKSWLGTMRDAQFSDGRIPHVIPDVLTRGGSPGWMDVATIIPWEIYLHTGDTQILSENYRMMERLVGWYRSQATGSLIPELEAFGDWLQPFAENMKGDTPTSFLGTAFYAKSTQILADTATILGRNDDAQHYGAEVSSIKAAFSKHYFDAEGKLRGGVETQTAYLLAIDFDLIPFELQVKVAYHLVRMVGEAEDHLRTGFLGTPSIVRVLDRMGYSKLAYSILFQETYPSWFYSINQGATTLWERWNSYSHEEGFGPVSMNSFNHYAYGAVGEWLYERVAGLAIDPAHPGYKHFFVKPIIGGPLTAVRAELETGYGKAASGWSLEGDALRLAITVPPNTSATLYPPKEFSKDIRESGKLLDLVVSVEVLKVADGQTVVRLEPGQFLFTCKRTNP